VRASKSARALAAVAALTPEAMTGRLVGLYDSLLDRRASPAPSCAASPVT
jgi:hypothetical protein